MQVAEVRQWLKAGHTDETTSTQAATPLHHARKKEPREAHNGLAIDADHAGFLFGLARAEFAVLAEAGVVDEDVDGEPGTLGRVVDLLRRGGIVEVRDDDAGFNALGGEFGGERFRALCAAGGQDEFCAAAREFTRERLHRCPRWLR